MIKRNRLAVLVTGALLSVGALSGCEKLDAEEENTQSETPEATEDVADGDETSDSNEQQDAPAEPDEAEPEVLDPNDGGEGSSSDSGDPSTDAAQAEVLATTHCPADVPAPFGPYEIEFEEDGDGTEVHCVVHVASGEDPVYLEQGITEQFKALQADQMENNTAADPYDPDDISVLSWNHDGYEFIVNIRYENDDRVELIYVVREMR